MKRYVFLQKKHVQNTEFPKKKWICFQKVSFTVFSIPLIDIILFVCCIYLFIFEK